MYAGLRLDIQIRYWETAKTHICVHTADDCVFLYEAHEFGPRKLK